MKNTIAVAPEEGLLVSEATCSPAAFAELYRSYYGRVYNYVRYRCDDTATAEDLTSLVFERLLARIDQYRPERGPFGAWLFAIARNIVNGHRRAQRYRQWLSIDILNRWPSGETGPEEAAMQNEAQAELLEAIGKLSERERDLLGLKFGGSLNNRQIAKLTGLSESNIGVILHRAISRLRAELGGSSEDRSSAAHQGAVP